MNARARGLHHLQPVRLQPCLAWPAVALCVAHALIDTWLSQTPDAIGLAIRLNTSSAIAAKCNQPVPLPNGQLPPEHADGAGQAPPDGQARS